MKKRLLALLAKKNERKQTIITKANNCESVEELRTFNTELDALNEEIRNLTEMINSISDEDPNSPNSENPAGLDENGQSERTRAVNGEIPGVVISGARAQEQQRRNNAGNESGDRYSTLEYRNAFMQFAKTGAISPELRADAVTVTSDVSAVIPTTILKEVISRLSVYGQVYARVRKLNIKGGVSVPILSLKPTATWIGETTPSERKKVQANSNVTFSYHGLECKIATSLLADTVTLEGFEQTVTELIVEAMIKAIDLGVVSGTGTGQMLGVTKDSRVPAVNIIKMTETDFATWNGWKKKVFAKMPLAYKAGATFLMASGTFEGYIDGMVDDNGQPIGRINYGITNGPQERFGGKEVILVEDDVIAPYDDAETDDVVAIYMNLSNYAVNSNLQMTMYRYLDHDTNQWVDKAILIADGKLLDPNGVVIVKKA